AEHSLQKDLTCLCPMATSRLMNGLYRQEDQGSQAAASIDPQPKSVRSNSYRELFHLYQLSYTLKVLLSCLPLILPMWESGSAFWYYPVTLLPEGEDIY